jgi:hypothetical protein
VASCVDTNDIPELIKKYGGKISSWAELNNGKATSGLVA